MELALAFVIDLWIGDPVYPFHPVRLMGKAIEAGEKILRRNPIVRTSEQLPGRISAEKWAGALLAVFIPAAVFVFAFALIRILRMAHPGLAFAAHIVGIYFALSIHDLGKEALRIYENLKKDDLAAARVNLGRIVGRDTENLDSKEVVRAAVESVAESTLDGVVAPLFYACLGGAPLALAYKAVNTLDSMIGHRNERYERFGFWAARQDELWNWLPARLCPVFISIASLFTGQRAQAAWLYGWRDGMTSRRGNGAIPEACFAGALGLQLGGVSHYQGRVESKPFLGLASKDFEPADLLRAVRLMIASSSVALIAFLILDRLNG